jgi:hypothetical protein
MPSDAMRLPEGKTCVDCRSLGRCRSLVGAKPEWKTCDFHPSRFVQAEEYDWMIYYEDTGKSPNLFRGTQEFACKVIVNERLNWTCHLYRRMPV